MLPQVQHVHGLDHGGGCLRSLFGAAAMPRFRSWDFFLRRHGAACTDRPAHLIRIRAGQGLPSGGGLSARGQPDGGRSRTVAGLSWWGRRAVGCPVSRIMAVAARQSELVLALSDGVIIVRSTPLPLPL